MATTEGFATQKVNRLSSMDAERADLYGGPSVSMPPKHLMASPLDKVPTIDSDSDRSQSEEDVLSSEDEQALATPMTVPQMTVSDDFALAFDIDGVLIRGGEAIPEAVEAIKYINGDNPYGVQVYVSISVSSLQMWLAICQGRNMLTGCVLPGPTSSSPTVVVRLKRSVART